LFAFSAATVAEARAAWLQENAEAGSRDFDRLTDLLEQRRRVIAVEQRTPDRTQRIVRAACPEPARTASGRRSTLGGGPRRGGRLDALLRPVRTAPSGDAEAACEPVAGAHTLLNFVRRDRGRASVGIVKRELERLGTIHAIALPDGLFDDALPDEIDLCRRHVAVEPPSDLRSLPEAARLAWLAAYMQLRGRAIVGDLVELPIDGPRHRRPRRAQRRATGDRRTREGDRRDRPSLRDRLCRLPTTFGPAPRVALGRPRPATRRRRVRRRLAGRHAPRASGTLDAGPKGDPHAAITA
jgi:hypothetical protein